MIHFDLTIDFDLSFLSFQLSRDIQRAENCHEGTANRQSFFCSNQLLEGNENSVVKHHLT